MKLRKTPIGYNLIIQEDELELCLIKEAYPLSNGYAIATYPRDEDIVCLSKQNCDELFGVVDVEKLDKKIRGLMMISGTSNGTIDHPNTDKMISLFNKAMELNKDKVFTKDDVISMIEKSRETGLTAEYIILSNQQNEWDVEIVTEEEFIFDPSMGISQGHYLNKPKLDNKGRLILKII